MSSRASFSGLKLAFLCAALLAAASPLRAQLFQGVTDAVQTQTHRCGRSLDSWSDDYRRASEYGPEAVQDLYGTVSHCQDITRRYIERNSPAAASEDESWLDGASRAARLQSR